MRILRLDLLAYGPFTDRTLELGGEPGVVQLIYGTNGAGKSSALRALIGLLFEIETRTTDDHVHEMPKLRIGALVDPGDGTKLEVVRRKGRKDTLRGLDGKPLVDNPFADALGGLDEALFKTMFALHHVRLREGGRQLARGDEALAESLFGAGLGRGVHGVLARLGQSADGIFAPRASKRPLNHAIRAHKEAKRDARDAQLRPTDWVKAHKELAALEAEGERIGAELKALEPHRARFERLRQLLPLIDGHDAYRDQRAELGDVVLLPDGARDERNAAQDVLRNAGLRLDKLTDEIADVEREIDELDIAGELLARAPIIKELGKQLGAQQKAIADRVNLNGRIALCRTNAEAVLTNLGRGPDLSQASALNVETVRQRRIRQLASDRGAREAELKGAAARREEAARKLEQAHQRLDALTEARDFGPLGAALEAARTAVELEDQLDKTAKVAARARGAADDRLAALGLWRGDLDDAIRLPLPPTETIDRFEVRWKDREQRWTLFEERRRELEAKLERVETDIAEMNREGEVATEAQLAVARHHRDAKWGVVRRVWLGGAEDVVESGLAPEPNGGASLADDYEHTVAAADSTADQLRAEADRAARYTQLLFDREALERRRGALGADRETLRARTEADEAAWRAIWHESGITPLPPGEMRPWLARHSKLADAIGAARDAERDHEARVQRIAALACRLGERLAELGIAVGDEGLGELVDRASSIVAAGRQTEDERRHLARQSEELVGELERAKKAWETAHSAIETWRADWQDAIGGLGLREDASPDEAEALLDELAQLRKHLDEERRLQIRRDGIGKLARQFDERVGEFVAECAPDLAGKPSAEVTDELLERLARSEKDEAARAKDTRRLEKLREERSRTELERASAQAKLDELLARAGCADVTALEQAEERSSKARALDAKLAERREQIRVVGAGKDVDTLRGEASQIDRDALPADIDELGRQIDELRDRRHENATAIGKNREALAAMDTGAAAAEATTRAQHEIASIRELARSYARSKLAAHLLEREVRRYREANQGPLLSRAGQLFARLTARRFRELAVDFDDSGEPMLRCVRADDALVEPSVLSDGEADQLYLALRVASLEQHLDRNPPVPFVADDIFVNFDDDRARAGFEVMGELAERTQVLFFTHHARLVELAKEALPDTRLETFTL